MQSCEKLSMDSILTDIPICSSPEEVISLEERLEKCDPNTKTYRRELVSFKFEIILMIASNAFCVCIIFKLRFTYINIGLYFFNLTQ